MSITVQKGGMLTTVQDLGRTGYQKYGVIVSGVMDAFSAKMANLLLGNKENEAVLEMTVLGPHLKFNSSAIICVTGGDLHPMLDGKSMGMWKPVQVSKGAELTFKGLRKGCRSYLAVKGGLALEEKMNSKSTYLRAGFGGYKGKKLDSGDVLELLESKLPCSIGEKLNWGLMPLANERPAKHAEVRFIKGPQYSWFIEESQKMFEQGVYTVLPNSDRMGYRLHGEKIEKVEPRELVTEAASFGTIQIPPDGQPIILMADRQTTGGYPKIGQVISVDLPIVAQMSPHSSITFKEVPLKEAQTLLLQENKLFEQIKTAAKLKWRDWS
ncbi:biotin-dependent carboxyltransferase family protein [Fictibacillus iocasae]|uniref:Biotin-dependent carboxyltransferase family protein n=1 Tax=Fictibacillus iocasae TaxID=2715437 RepID=A0ABW2NLQ7_9BACL